MIMPIEIGDERYLNTKEASETLGISRAKLHELVRDGKLKQYEQPVRNVPLYKESEVLELLNIRER